MEFNYEIVSFNDGLPFKLYIVNLEHFMMHCHRAFEVMWVLKGSVTLSTLKGDMILNEGDIYVVNLYEIHGFMSDGQDNLIIGLQMDLAIGDSCYIPLESVVITKQYYPFIETNNQMSTQREKIVMHLISVFDVLSSNLTMPLSYESTALAMSNVFAIIGILIQQGNYKALSQTEVHERNEDFMRLRSILNYMSEHAHRKISLKEIGDLNFMSRFYISHFIKKNVGIGFSQLLSSMRFSKALDYIKYTEDTFVSIAAITGFSDVKYLNAMVKKQFQMTPTQLRKTARSSTRINDISHKAFKGMDMELNEKLTRKFCVFKEGHRNIDVEEVLYYMKKGISEGEVVK